MNDFLERHVLHSLGIAKIMNFEEGTKVLDIGTGGGFPGIILALYYQNYNFHVKLYEKSPTKSDFLSKISQILDLKCKIICSDVNLIKTKLLKYKIPNNRFVFR